MGRQTGPGGPRGVSEASPKPPGRLLTAPGWPGEMAKASGGSQEAAGDSQEALGGLWDPPAGPPQDPIPAAEYEPNK